MPSNSPVLQPTTRLRPMGRAPFGGVENILLATKGIGDKIKVSQSFHAWVETLDKRDILVSSDGSQETDINELTTGIGAAWVLKWGEQWLGMNGFSLGVNAEVYDAEALAMLGRLEAAIASPMARLVLGIHICLDNLSVARNAGQTTKGSSQAAFKKFRDIAKIWLQSGKRLTVQWIPAHTGILGNEIADREAKKYAKIAIVPGSQPVQTLACAKRSIRRKKDVAWQLEWETHAHSGAIKTYQDLGL